MLLNADYNLRRFFVPKFVVIEPGLLELSESESEVRLYSV